MPNRDLTTSVAAILRMQRQVLRAWMHTDEPTGTVALNKLAAALTSPDWELRMTAVLAAARRQVIPLALQVRRVEIPRTSREGLDVVDRQILRALHTAAMRLLSGEPISPDANEPPQSREEIQNYVLRCAAGVDTRWCDRIWWWTHTLTIPISLSLPPTSLPEGIVIGDDGVFRLALTEIELVWVGPGVYWLGDERINDLRRVYEPDGFFLARLPVAQDYTQPAAPSRMEWQEALDLCERIAAIEQLSVSLPSTDQWEIAARGIDSRRYPWGNGYEPGAAELSAPCGALQMVGATPQWTGSTDDVYLSGGAADHHCGVHILSTSSDERAAVRPVIRVWG